MNFVSKFLEQHPEVQAVLVSKAPSQEETATAFRVLQYSLMIDTGYAWSWHCNLAMASVDEGMDHVAANRAAARFMKNCFDVDVTLSPEWKSLFREAA